MIEPSLTPALSQKERGNPQPQAVSRRWQVFAHALLFVLGFSLIFIIGWGGAVTPA